MAKRSSLLVGAGAAAAIGAVVATRRAVKRWSVAADATGGRPRHRECNERPVVTQVGRSLIPAAFVPGPHLIHSVYALPKACAGPRVAAEGGIRILVGPIRIELIVAGLPVRPGAVDIRMQQEKGWIARR